MNVVTQLTQFVGHDVINKTRLVGCKLLGQLSWVELCRLRHPFKRYDLIHTKQERLRITRNTDIAIKFD